MEAVAGLVPDGPQDARGIVDERQVVEHADDAVLQVLAASEGMDQAAEVGFLQRDGHRVDREVAAVEVLRDRRRLHYRERTGREVALRARGHDVDPVPVAVLDDRGAELLVRRVAPAERFREGAPEPDRIAFHRDVDVEALGSEEDVPHGAADEVDAVDRALEVRDRREHGLHVRDRDLLDQEA